MADRKMIRFGIFRQSDIDDNGEIKKGAPIVGYYAPNYDRPDNPITFEGATEHWGQEHNYDGMYHEGRHFDVDSTDEKGNNTPLFRNHAVKNRGTSALDYVRGREPQGDYWDKWERTPLVSFDEAERDRLNYNNPNGKYERVSTHLIAPGNSIIPKSDDEEVSRLAESMRTFHNKPNVLGEKTIVLPYEITVDPSKIVDFEKVKNMGFEPARDYLSERQFEGYKVQRLPSGLLRAYSPLVNPRYTDDVQNAVEEFGYNVGHLGHIVNSKGSLPESNYEEADKLLFRASILIRMLEALVTKGYSTDRMKNAVQEAKLQLDIANKSLGLIKEKKPQAEENKRPEELVSFGESLFNLENLFDTITSDAGFNNAHAGEKIVEPLFNTSNKSKVRDFLYREFDPKNPTNSDVRIKNIEGAAFRPAERSHANFMAWHLNKELADKNLRSDLLKGLWRH